MKLALGIKTRMLEQARDWPVADGFVLHNGQSRDADGLLKVTLSYMYKVNEEEFFGGESFRFRVRTMRSGLSPDAENESSRFISSRISRRFPC